jgi:hypothetical protein
MGFPALPSATAELVVINLIAQHDPQPNPQLATGCYGRFPQSFLCQFAGIEPLQLGIVPHGMSRRFAPPKAQHRIALLG